MNNDEIREVVSEIGNQIDEVAKMYKETERGMIDS